MRCPEGGTTEVYDAVDFDGHERISFFYDYPSRRRRERTTRGNKSNSEVEVATLRDSREEQGIGNPRQGVHLYGIVPETADHWSRLNLPQRPLR